jgi:SNF2 family DNA or RNA helicase
VHPTNETGRQLKLIEKDLERAKRGLIIVFDDDSETQQIQLSRARGPPRSLRPETSQLLYASIDQTIEESDKILATNVAVLSEKTKLLRNIERASEVPDEVRQMSSFESLEAMAEKDYKKTFCAICLGVLGSSDPKSTDEAKPGMVALTSCGHLFCEKCIADYMQQTTASYRQPQCPTCRKDINKSNLVYVDPSLSDVIWEEEIKQRTKAKTVIKQAAQMLEKSNGQLNPELWLQLYLSIDVPDHVSQRGDFRLSAIPKELVAFFRAATGFSEIHNKVCALPDIEPLHGLSSKAHALVRDLPKGERSVVFTSSRTAVKHLLSVFEYHKIGFRALFSGQQPSEAELAVQDWKDTDLSISNDFSEPRVLIVQSGAAASGLTLTAACKMFFLEPFIRQEEEQQAYARCHRFGQEDEVNVKVYFTPVSVESRLLEWRKLTSSTTPSDTKVVFTDMWEMMDSCEEDILSEEEERDGDSDVEDSDQTLFLLGLKQS